jgi:glycosyltransferase involved in cell wall biosynthesis
MKVAIIDGIAAHYRLLLFQKLSQQADNEYKLFASKVPLNGIAIIDPALADLDASRGGVNWTFIHNVVVLKRIVWQKNVMRIAAKGKFDVYIFIGESHVISTWIGVALCRLRKRKIVFWGHGVYGNEKFIKKYFRRIFNKLPDAYLIYNERTKELLIKDGIKEEKLFVVYNSLNYDAHVVVRNSITREEICQLKKKLFLKNDELPVLLFIGRLTPEKKIDQLIGSINILHSKGKKVNCVIIGSGDEEMSLKKLVINYNLQDYIFFYGPGYNESQNGLLLSMANCCVSPGNVGLTAIHSLSFGTPVITHNDLPNQGPEVSSVIENFTGELFVRNDMDDLASHIEELVFIKGKEHYRDNCIKIIDDFYNPYYQIKIFNALIQYLTK